MILEFKPVLPALPFKDIERETWTNWNWQMRQTLKTAEDFSSVFELSTEERQGFKISQNLFKIAVTPYYASLALESPALRSIVIPRGAEAQDGAQQMLDPLGEHIHSPTPRIVHRYSDRVLFLITDVCSVYCRFCTRKRFTGGEEGFISENEYTMALDYIKSHRGIREVIFSGGDPLTLSNQRLSKILSDIRKIPHIEIIRIGSRMPVVCPTRIDEELVKILKQNGPTFMMTHFNHPKELTRDAASALGHLVDNGIPTFNQMVLLNGVNNHPAIVQALSRRLLYLRVKPYYMFQCDPSEGTDHLRTTVESSETMVRELWGHLSGLAMPILSLDIPSGGGKTTLVPDFMIKKEEGLREFRGWDGRTGVYKNPTGLQLTPLDATEYFAEWESLKLKNWTLA